MLVSFEYSIIEQFLGGFIYTCGSVNVKSCREVKESSSNVAFTIKVYFKSFLDNPGHIPNCEGEEEFPKSGFLICHATELFL